jgi:precorrin-6B methylase 2
MDIYKSDKTKLPANFDPNWIEDGKGLTMQMILEDKKNAKNNLVMTCVTLEKQSVILRKSDYKSLTGY